LKDGGKVVLGVINSESWLGVEIQSKKTTSPFYRGANLSTVGEVLELLKSTGFKKSHTWQTLLSPACDDIVQEGHDQGGFVVIEAFKDKTLIS